MSTKGERKELCLNCNNGLGRFKDNVDFFFKSAINYLVKDVEVDKIG